MIKANELRLGNFVNVPREDQSPFRIDAFEYLSNKYIKVAMIHPDFGEKMHPLTWYDDDLSPIALTEEWLLKFKEIEKKADGLFIFKLPFDYEIRIVEGKKGYTFWTETTLLFLGTDSVHQLQNIYFTLTGAELTVA